ncbi:MAG: LamG-like jellyroll fold domain-containing protein [Candidatus Falkowbacteria bacterium]
MPKCGKIKSGFTLIELLVVIVIIGVLASLTMLALNNARAKSRDAKRVNDIRQISTAVELYYAEYGIYPSSIANAIISADGTKTYMAKTPTNPSPMNDGSCGADNYTYATTSDATDYSLNFCLAYGAGALSPGIGSVSKGGFDTAPGLIGWWKFSDGNSPVIDSSGKSNSGSNNGATWGADSGQYGGGAYTFDGVNDAIATNSNILNNATEFTIAFWTKPLSFGGWKGMIGKGTSDTNVITVQADTGGRIYVDVDNGVSNSFANTGLGVLSVGQWAHVAAVYQGSGATNADRVKVYVNGANLALTFSGTIPTQTATSNAGILYIGQLGYASNFYNGIMDDVRIYSRSLLPEEISALYNFSK